MARRKTAATVDTAGGSSAVIRRLQEGGMILTMAVAIFLLIALITYHRADPGWSTTAGSDHIANAGGRAGAWFADFTLYLFGYSAFLFPIVLAYAAWRWLRRVSQTDAMPPNYIYALRGSGFILIMSTSSGLASLFLTRSAHLPFSAGGILGDTVGLSLTGLFSPVGSALLLVAVLLASITICTGVSWIKTSSIIIKYAIITCHYGLRLLTQLSRHIVAMPYHGYRWLHARFQQQRIKQTPTISRQPNRTSKSTKRSTVDLQSIAAPPKPAEITKQSIAVTPTVNRTGEIRLPELSLLDPASTESSQGYSAAELENMSCEVEAKLRDFGIEAHVVAVHPGPVITRFELQPAAGVKASKITSLAKDLARSLSVMSVRVVEVIPGKSVVGLEVPNQHRDMVRLSEVIGSSAYQQSHSLLTLALGHDIAGHSVVVDLAKMPHLLVAGTTGSGKSVGLNVMLLSLLYKATPSDVRMILVDPKMLELAVYDGIPHLLTPVVTDMKEAANALRWCVAEMERRYRLMAALGVRNLTGFNNKIIKARDAGKPIQDPLYRSDDSHDKAPELETLPYIVVLIDEFADMMMVVGKKVEQLIARIAQKARAAGIHLILATQRPSVDVITGLIKANVPTRIAFQVSSRVDSRTILDQQGAENLLGYGDMLYMAPGTGVPMRVHGAFVDDHEVHNVVNAWKAQRTPDYVEDILNSTATSNDVPMLTGLDEDSDNESDPLYDQAVQIVIDTRRASISGIQRRLKIGYNRAARLIETMEAAGLVSPMENNGNREVLVPSQE